ncbi:MAG: hypothetical protein HFJ30_08440, partial [Clostridia bacterium]|nr:hypothetical protein [Clostridia bacterium]
MKIEFISQYALEGKSLTVKNLKVNQKEIPLEYKYLPTALVEKVKNISINYKTSRERIEMIKDALELSTQKILTGAGGGAWQYKYKEVQDYEYESKILHSYPAKIALEFGVIGIIAYVGIGISMIVILIKLVKKQNIEMIAILFAFALLGIHFVIDVDMEYIHIIIFTFMLMGIISTELKSKENSSKWLYVQDGICLLVIIVGIYLTLNQSSYNKYEKTLELIEQENPLVEHSKETEELNYEIAKGYENIIKFERYNELENYYEMTKYYLNSNYEKKDIKLEECYKKVASYENKNPNNMERISLKIKCAYSMINELEKLNNPQYYEVTEKFINIILEEYEKTKNELEQYMANQQIDIQNYINGLERLYKDVTELKSTYLMGTKVWNESDIPIDENELEKLEIEEVKDVFIYHTHGTESYKADKKYENYKFYKSLDKNYNVIKIGEELTKLLKQKEINAIHDTTYYNYPKENEDYRNARKGTEKILDKNEQVNRIIDVHRDAYSEEEHNASTIEINGEKVANLRFVIGINKEDKNWMYDLKWAIEMQKQANKKYPGLMQPILIREENYNQDLGKYAILIEVGENCNKVEHALNSIKYFAEIFM